MLDPESVALQIKYVYYGNSDGCYGCCQGIEQFLLVFLV